MSLKPLVRQIMYIMYNVPVDVQYTPFINYEEN